METNRELYNLVSIKNIDNEDFVFSVDKQQYIIPAGQVRRFPRFMAVLGVKHLIDKLLQKQSPKGDTLTNQARRDEIGAKIVINEETYEEPRVPTAREIVEEVNKPTDIERILEKNKGRLKAEDNLIPVPEKTPKDIVTEEANLEEDEEFEGLEEDTTTDEEQDATGTTEDENKMPTRAEMLEYAKNTLNMDMAAKIEDEGENYGKTFGEVLATMSDVELYQELQMGV